jgi:multiple sugar transport system ATP-binding protein
VYAHLALDGRNGAGSFGEPVLRELAAATADTPSDALPTDSLDVIARLDSSSSIGEGKEGELWLDTGHLHLFDPESGERLAA